jgi:hypothetical protein
MRCAGCGQTLTEGVSVCLQCGTPVPPGYVAKRAEVALLPDPVPPSGDNWSDAFHAPPTSPYQQKYTEFSAPTTPPPPPIYAGHNSTDYGVGLAGNDPYHTGPYPRTAPDAPVAPRLKRARQILAVTLVLAVAFLGLGAFAYARAHGAIRTTSGPGGDLANQPSAVCTIPSIDANAARNLTHTQFTTGLVNSAKKDYSPIDVANTFHVGQTVYFTFTVASNANATLTSVWCFGTAGNKPPPYQRSTNHSLGVQGYFSLGVLDDAAIGNGVLVVYWNDAIAFVGQFIVVK